MGSQKQHDMLKETLIVEATHSNISVEKMSDAIDDPSELMRMAQTWYKAFSRLHVIQVNLIITALL